MASIRAITIKIYSLLFGKSIIKNALSKFNATDNILKQKLKDVLNDVTNGKLSSDEINEIKKIESLRKRLKQSTETIKRQDFGTSAKNNENQNIPLKNIALIGKSGIWAIILFKLIRFFKPQTCLELGTCLGFSAAYQAAALKLNNSGGFIVTLEGDPSLANIASDNLKKLDLENSKVVTGLFQDTLGLVLEKNKIIDYAFIDGHHDEKATINYFHQILPYLSQNALLIFDDISWSDGMKRVWQKIKDDERVNISIDLFVVGICIISKIK